MHTVSNVTCKNSIDTVNRKNIANLYLMHVFLNGLYINLKGALAIFNQHLDISLVTVNICNYKHGPVNEVK